MRHTTALLGLVTTATAGHVSIPFSREKFSHPLARLKRDDTEPLSLEALNNLTGGGYYSEFEIGTPPQRINFLLDTGSSDTWANSVDADLCNDRRMQATMGFCQTQFDPDESDSFELVDRNGFDITYLDSRNIKGDYFEDTVTLGDIKVKKQQLGLALESVRPTGIMGLGFSSNVAADDEYPTIIDNLVEQGFIDTRVFSLYLNDLDTNAGNILFGGIDRKKLIGELVTLPLVSESTSSSSDITSYNVAISGFDVRDSQGNTTINMPNLNSKAILDSGSTISLLPDDQVRKLWREFNVVSDKQVIAPFIDCSYAGEKGEGYVFEFRFDNKTIQVPIHEMVIDAYADYQTTFLLDERFSDFESVCMFGIGSTADFGIDTDQFTLLGATFLRSAYVVYDLANKQLGLAQANLNETDSDIIEVKSDDLPEITGVASQASQTGPSRTDSAGSGSTGGSGDGDDDEDHAAGGIAPPAMAAMTVMGLVGAVIVAL